MKFAGIIPRVSDQNGVSLLYIMLEIHHSGQEPSICSTEIISILGSNMLHVKMQVYIQCLARV